MATTYRCWFGTKDRVSDMGGYSRGDLWNTWITELMRPFTISRHSDNLQIKSYSTWKTYNRY